MLIQKTFHLHMLQDSAKTRLANLSDYRRHFSGVELATLTPEGAAHFVCRLPWGFRAEVELVQVACENPAQTLFRSRRGNVEVLGVLEYFQIQPNLTEVVLTLDYTIASPLFRLIDTLGNHVDRFVNRQLEGLEAHFSHPAGEPDAESNLPAPINHHPQTEGAD